MPVAGVAMSLWIAGIVVLMALGYFLEMAVSPRFNESFTKRLDAVWLAITSDAFKTSHQKVAREVLRWLTPYPNLRGHLRDRYGERFARAVPRWLPCLAYWALLSVHTTILAILLSAGSYRFVEASPSRLPYCFLLLAGLFLSCRLTWTRPLRRWRWRGVLETAVMFMALLVAWTFIEWALVYLREDNWPRAAQSVSGLLLACLINLVFDLLTFLISVSLFRMIAVTRTSLSSFLVLVDLATAAALAYLSFVVLVFFAQHHEGLNDGTILFKWDNPYWIRMTEPATPLDGVLFYPDHVVLMGYTTCSLTAFVPTALALLVAAVVLGVQFAAVLPSWMINAWTRFQGKDLEGKKFVAKPFISIAITLSLVVAVLKLAWVLMARGPSP